MAAAGVVRKRAIRIVGESREQVAVAGLEPGTLVIVPGAEHLAEGEPVEVVVSDPDREGTGADVAQ